MPRRRLLQSGAAGAVGLWIGARVAGRATGVAEAAPLAPQLRRSTWLDVTDPAFQVDVGAGRTPWRLVDVADLPIAEQIPALRDHDAAFALRFSGPAGLAQGTRTLHHPALGTFELFAVPVEAAAGPSALYEGIVDRTVRIAGVNEEGVPTVVVSEPRAAQPAPAPGASVPPSSARPAGAKALRPRLRGAQLVRGTSKRILLADLRFADAAAVGSVRGQLLSRGKVVARTSVTVRRPTRLRLRFAGARPLAHGRYELRLTLVGRDGRVTHVRKTIRFS